MAKKGEHFPVNRDVVHRDLDVLEMHGDKGSLQYIDVRTWRQISFATFCAWKLLGKRDG